MRLLRFGLVALLLAACCQAFAAGPRAVRKQVETSRLVKGTVDIDANGHVVGYALEKIDGLPPGVHAMFARALPQWRFEPISLPEGKTRARTSVSLRLVAKKVADDSFTVEIRGAQFGEPAAGEHVSMAEKPRPPHYPEAAVMAGVGGTVYVVMRVGRDGRVENAMTEQVNLRIVSSEHAMRGWRELLSKAALRVARDYRFNLPTHGPHVDAPGWSVRVPFDFRIGNLERELAVTDWEAYVPGPRADVPWIDNEEREAADAMAGTGMRPLDGVGYRLVTPLQPAGG